MPFLEPIGECQLCDRDAYFNPDGTKYCTFHSSALNEIDVDHVLHLDEEVNRVDGVTTNILPLGFVGVAHSTWLDELPWEVHELAAKYDYRVSEYELLLDNQYILEPPDPKIPYEDVEEYLDEALGVDQ